jgi:hypothetical protein
VPLGCAPDRRGTFTESFEDRRIAPRNYRLRHVLVAAGNSSA